MIELVIKEVNNYIYTLETNNKQYKITMEFNIDIKPQINDKIYMYEQLLQERFLSFGYLDNECGRNIHSSKDIDLIILVTNNNKVFLKRLYG